MLEQQGCRFHWRVQAGEPDCNGHSKLNGIIDFDTRRVITVHMEATDPTQTVGRDRLGKHMDSLEPNVVAIRTNADNELLATMTAEEDRELIDCVQYPTLDEVQACASRPVPTTIIRSELLELDRLGFGVDLVRYQVKPTRPASRRQVPSRGAVRRQVHAAWVHRQRQLGRYHRDARRPNMRTSVFKYEFHKSFPVGLWKDLGVLLNLPPHPNVISIEHLVLDETYNLVVGFTTSYIRGGTLEANGRVFKLDWLRQLIGVIDDLNLKHGVMHQDVFPRNIIIDEEHDRLMLFDFDFAGLIGFSCSGESWSDVKGVILCLYEIITRDKSHAPGKLGDADSMAVEEMETWVQHPDVELDHPVHEYRTVLDEWVARRRARKPLLHYKDAPEYIDWPVCPKSGPNPLMFVARQQGLVIVEWARPPQSKLKKDSRLLCNGKFI